MTVLQQPAHGFTVAREVALPVLAVAVIVASSDIRIPLALPGHRGLVWLTVLVAVALVARRRECVVLVGAASTMVTSAFPAASGPGFSGRYVAAAVLLYVVAAIPVVCRQRWLLSLAAAPIHVVAFAGSVFAVHHSGYLSGMVSTGTAQRAGFHLIFGLVAGLLALAIASGMERLSSVNPAGDASRPEPTKVRKG